MTDLTEQTLREIELSKRRPASARALACQAHWKLFLDTLESYLRTERGSASRLARYLGVNRQNVHRWFKERHTKIPAWVAVWTNVWFCEQGKICPPGERQTRINFDLPARAGSAVAHKAA